MVKSGFSGRKTLVTGAGGFIGSHLCEALLDEGAQVTAMIRYSSRSDWGNLEHIPAEKKARLKVISGNVEDAHFTDRAVEGQDVVFHLAALIAIPYSYVAPTSYVRTNVEGTLNVLEACRRHKTSRMVHTSTSETYGTAIYAPIDEKHPLQGQSPYSASKIGADKLCESYHLSFETPVATLRPFNTFGPRQSARAVIPTIISQALWEDEIRLGSLDPVRDLNYVKNTVDGFLKVAQSDAAIGQVINVGSGKGITIGDLAKRILSLMGIEKPIRLDEKRVRPAQSEVMNLLCESKKARELVGWIPRYSLDEGLKESIEFVRQHRELFKTGQYTV